MVYIYCPNVKRTILAPKHDSNHVWELGEMPTRAAQCNKLAIEDWTPQNPLFHQVATHAFFFLRTQDTICALELWNAHPVVNALLGQWRRPDPFDPNLVCWPVFMASKGLWGHETHNVYHTLCQAMSFCRLLLRYNQSEAQTLASSHVGWRPRLLGLELPHVAGMPVGTAQDIACHKKR